MRYIFLLMAFGLFLVLPGCEEIGGVPECSDDDLCVSWETNCDGDGMYFYCAETDSECKASCERICDEAGFSGYSGDCGYNSQTEMENCWCVD